MTNSLGPSRCFQTASCGCTIWRILLVGSCEAVSLPWVSLWWFLKGYIGRFDSFRCLSLPKWPKLRCVAVLHTLLPWQAIAFLYAMQWLETPWRSWNSLMVPLCFWVVERISLISLKELSKRDRLVVGIIGCLRW